MDASTEQLPPRPLFLFIFPAGALFLVSRVVHVERAEVLIFPGREAFVFRRFLRVQMTHVENVVLNAVVSRNYFSRVRISPFFSFRRWSD